MALPDEHWAIVLYENSSGRKVVREFIDSLQPAPYAKTLRAIDLLRQYGPTLGMPHSKKLNYELSELRIRGVIDVRIFYTIVDQTFYLLNGFVKKSQQTPQREIRVAQARLKDIVR